MKSFKMNIFIIILLSLFIGAFYLLESSFFYVTTVEVVGDNETLKKDIIDKLQGFKNDSIIYIDTKMLEEEILKDARVLDVKVYKKLPSTLKVNLNERKPAGFIKLDKFYVIDDNINIFANFDELSDKNYPVVNQIENDEEKRVISKILQQLIISDIFKMSSEIIKYKEYYAIILEDGTRIFVDEDITRNKLNQSYVVYKKEKNNNDLEYIDLRFDSIIVK